MRKSSFVSRRIAISVFLLVLVVAVTSASTDKTGTRTTSLADRVSIDYVTAQLRLIELQLTLNHDQSSASQNATESINPNSSIKLSTNQNPLWFTEGFIAFHPINVEYSGKSIANLRFELQNAPSWISIERDGTLRALPPLGSSGTGYNILLRVTDSTNTHLATTLALRINVAPKVSLNTQAKGNELRVSEPGSNLHDMRFVFSSDTATDRSISVVSAQYLPPIPSQYEQLSDIFYSTQDNTGKVEVQVPMSILANEADVVRLALFHRINGSLTMFGWSSGFTAREVRTIGGKEYAIVRSYSIKGEAFVGLKPRN